MSRYDTDAGYRVLKQGGEKYDKYFPKIHTPENILIKRSGDLEDSIKLIQDTARSCTYQTAHIAKVLKGANLESTCENIWKFCYSFIQYKLDEPGKEQVRKPARAWHDRHEGIDCDCFSVFISSILLNLNIAHYFKITDYGRGYQHIYVVVPKFGQSKEDVYIIDAVLPKFNFEKTPIVNSRFIFMQVQLLGNPGIDTEKELLQQNVAAMQANPQLFQEHFDVPAFLQISKVVLENWEDVAKRNELLSRVSGGLSGFEDDSDLDDLGVVIVKNAKKGNPAPNQRTVTAPAQKNVKTFFSNLKDKLKVKDTNGDGKTNGKDVAHAFTRILPITVVMRNSFLLFLSIKGIRKLLNRLYSDPSKKDAVAKLEKWYYSTGGKPEKLREVANKPVNGFEGLGEPITISAALVTAAPMVIAFLKLLSDAGILTKQPPKNPEDLKQWLVENNIGLNSDDAGSEGVEDTSRKTNTDVVIPVTNEDAPPQEQPQTGKFISTITENPMLVLGIVLVLLFIMFKKGSGPVKRGNGGFGGLDGLDGVKKRRKRRKKPLGEVGEPDSTELEDDGLGATKKRKAKRKTTAKKAATTSKPKTKAATTARGTTAKRKAKAKPKTKTDSDPFKLM